MKISFWALGWRSLWRDVRAGELRLVVLAVTLAVAALTAVGFLADRLQAGLQRDAQQLLGGDAVIASDRPLEATYAAQALALGLQTASTLSFPTMARAAAAQAADAAREAEASRAEAADRAAAVAAGHSLPPAFGPDTAFDPDGVPTSFVAAAWHTIIGDHGPTCAALEAGDLATGIAQVRF
jgi:hypothetical protein